MVPSESREELRFQPSLYISKSSPSFFETHSNIHMYIPSVSHSFVHSHTWEMINNTSSGASLPGLWLQLCLFSAAWLWASGFIQSSPSFLTYGGLRAQGRHPWVLPKNGLHSELMMMPKRKVWGTGTWELWGAPWERGQRLLALFLKAGGLSSLSLQLQKGTGFMWKPQAASLCVKENHQALPIPTPRSPRRPLNHFPSPSVCLFWAFHINEIVWFVVLCDRLLSLSTVLSRFAYV